MPFSTPPYNPPAWLRYGHSNTISTFLFRKPSIRYERERLHTPDGDFLDVDASRVGGKAGLIIVHGLEGSSNSGYVKGMALAANARGLDALALNLRGCSGEPNLTYASYHSGKTDDLHTAVEHFAGRYERLFITGFSLGGNLTLKYMGERGDAVPSAVAAAAAVSVPCDLKGSSVQLAKWDNGLYMLRFLRSLKKKALDKKERFPDAPFTKADIERVKGFRDFDDLYTAPAHGFKDAEDYWASCSSKQFLPNISRNTLLISAADDPFLSASCFPVEIAEKHVHFHFQMPRFGGHVGFAEPGWQSAWHEGQVMAFFGV